MSEKSIDVLFVGACLFNVVATLGCWVSSPLGEALAWTVAGIYGVFSIVKNKHYEK